MTNSDYSKNMRLNHLERTGRTAEEIGMRKTIEAMGARITQMEIALAAAKEKLEVYRSQTDGVYAGAMEHRSLLMLINAALRIRQ